MSRLAYIRHLGQSKAAPLTAGEPNMLLLARAPVATEAFDLTMRLLYGAVSRASRERYRIEAHRDYLELLSGQLETASRTGVDVDGDQAFEAFWPVALSWEKAE